MSIYRRVLKYYRPFLPQTLLGLALSLVGIGLNLLKPWPFKIIVDNVLSQRKDGFCSSVPYTAWLQFSAWPLLFFSSFGALPIGSRIIFS